MPGGGKTLNRHGRAHNSAESRFKLSSLNYRSDVQRDGQNHNKRIAMTYCFKKKVAMSFDEAILTVTEELKKEGFGILTDIDVKATLKKKLDVEFSNYRILGACNAPFAYRALQAEPRIGTMLPCNVIVRELDDGTIEVAAVDPLASMQAVQNEKLQSIAREIREKLNNVIGHM